MIEQTETALLSTFSISIANIQKFQYNIGFIQEICRSQFLSDSKLEWTPLAF